MWLFFSVTECVPVTGSFASCVGRRRRHRRIKTTGRNHLRTAVGQAATQAHHGGLAEGILSASTRERSRSMSTVCFMCSARISSG